MPVTLRQIVSRGLRCRCPNCGGPLIFERGLRLREQCPAPGCGLRWQRNPGYYLGAAVWNYTLTVFLVLPFVFLTWAAGWISEAVAIVLAVIVALVSPLLLYKAAWSLWMMSYYFFLPHELPANATELIPTRDDE
ncbi:MAG: DUF983 domain-containing protein [Opitutales bacterium]|jgi:uncharacterized protein (DUF983 family)